MKQFLYVVLVSLVMTSCTTLNRGDVFQQTVDGVGYSFEVIVSKMNYVRLLSVAEPSIAQGEIVIPSTVKYDGENFLVTQIGKEAFMNFESLMSVELPATLSVIEEKAFAGCTNLENINTPQPLSSIGDYAFDGCHRLHAFSLDASISKLGKGVFRDCYSLERLEFPSSFTIVPDELCEGCVNLKEITLPATISTIGNNAFADCVKAKSITLGASVRSIGVAAFVDCENVAELTITTPRPPVCDATTFVGIDPMIRVVVPMAQVQDYSTAVGWNYFKCITGAY